MATTTTDQNSTNNPTNSTTLTATTTTTTITSAFVEPVKAAPLVPQNPTEALEKFKKPDSSKVVIRFRAIGNAPILKQLNYKINAANKFQAVIKFLRKELNYKTSDPLFVYINSAFSPAPDEIVANLFKCFSTDGRQLIVNYCTSAAWG